MTPTEFTSLPDLASRALAGSVVTANDELFAERENLIKPEPPVFSTADFGNKGKVYDGWETRRRREPGFDHAIVRLGIPGVVRGVIIDTAWFAGNYPPFASVEATSMEGHPSPQDLEMATWETILEKSAVEGDAANRFEVSDERRFTHVRLCIYPDGGVARFRVHGEPVPDPRLLTGTIDLAALEHGGAVIDCSNRFYSSPLNMLAPGRARNMGEGWENARRRDDGNDYVTIRLAARGTLRRVELDTSYYIGNAAGWASLKGIDAADRDLTGQDLGERDLGGRALTSDGSWFNLVPRTRLQPDTRHFFRIGQERPVTHVRLDVFPDGGISRLRVHGELTPDAQRGSVTRWLDLLPETHALEVLVADGGVDVHTASALFALRPFTGSRTLPDETLDRFLR
jgi:allantoicase